MINLTNHCKERYVERIKGITDTIEIKTYVAQNDDKITEHILKLYEYSTFLYKGQIGTDRVTRMFYINDDIVLVLDTAETCIISMYKVDFGFPKHTNKAVIKDLISELEIINSKLEQEVVIFNELKEVKQNEIEDLALQIKNLQEQIEILEAKKKIEQSNIEAGMLNINFLHKQAEHYATMLCNSLDFKRDIKNGK